MGIVVILNVIFWAIMIVPIYLLVLSWGFRMLYYWSCGRKFNSRPKVMRKRVSKLYTKEERDQI